MIPLHRIEQAIPDLTGLAVLIIAVCAFMLSFANLQAVAIESGINHWLSPLWPICIDALLIAGSLMILRSSIRNESPLVGWSVLLVFTAISTLFNVLHSPAEWTAQAAHAVPPVALCVSIELLMMTIRSDLQTSGHVCNHGRDRACDRVTDIHDRTAELDDHPSDQGSDLVDRSERIRSFFAEHPDSSIAKAARELGMSWYTVKRYKPDGCSEGDSHDN